MNQENYILFDQYLANELSADEKLAFEKKLFEDTAFYSDFEVFKELNLHLKNKFENASDLNAFKQNLKSISKENYKAKKTKILAFKPWQYAVAASIVIFFGLFISQNINPTFEEYNSPEKAYFVERSNGNTTIKNAQDAFNTSDYKSAISYFEILTKENNSPEMAYFYAISLLEDNQFQKAETVLSKIKDGNSVYKNKAIWYLALSKLKQKDYNSCKKILLTISEDFENYEQVQNLLNDLE